MESLLYHIDGKRQEKERYIPNPAIHIRTLVHIFIPFGLHSSRTLNPGRPITTWSAMKFPDGLRSFAGLRISGASSVGCDGTFRTPSVSGLTSCPSFSFSATSGVGGASSNCILRSRVASSDLSCFSSSSFFHTMPATFRYKPLVHKPETPDCSYYTGTSDSDRLPAPNKYRNPEFPGISLWL